MMSESRNVRKIDPTFHSFGLHEIKFDAAHDSRLANITIEVFKAFTNARQHVLVRPTES
jgi:hypothetical protein